MQFANLQEFLTMGGYAFYVWTAYAIVFGALVFNLGQAFFKHRQIKLKLLQILKSRPNK